MRERELRERVDRLARIHTTDANHAGPAGSHPLDQCRYCARWVHAVIEVWDAADQFYGPRTIAEGVRDIAKREWSRPVTSS